MSNAKDAKRCMLAAAGCCVGGEMRYTLTSFIVPAERVVKQCVNLHGHCLEITFQCQVRAADNPHSPLVLTSLRRPMALNALHEVKLLRHITAHAFTCCIFTLCVAYYCCYYYYSW